MSFLRKYKVLIMVGLTILQISITPFIYLNQRLKTQRIEQVVQYRSMLSDSTNSLLVQDFANLKNDIISQNNSFSDDLIQLGVVLGLIISLANVLTSAMNKNSFDKINLRLDKNEIDHDQIVDTTTLRHNELINEIQQVKDLNVRKDVIDEFRAIINLFCGSKTEDQNLRLFLDRAGEHLIDFASASMEEQFTRQNQQLSIIKIESAILAISEEAILLLGEKFEKQYGDMVASHVVSFKLKLVEIGDDTLTNHKYERFKRITQVFFQDVMLSQIQTFYLVKK